jgi:hypothetical protein
MALENLKKRMAKKEQAQEIAPSVTYRGPRGKATIRETNHRAVTFQEGVADVERAETEEARESGFDPEQPFGESSDPNDNSRKDGTQRMDPTNDPNSPFYGMSCQIPDEVFRGMDCSLGKDKSLSIPQSALRGLRINLF